MAHCDLKIQIYWQKWVVKIVYLRKKHYFCSIKYMRKVR